MFKSVKYILFSLLMVFSIKNAVSQQVTLVEDYNKSIETRISDYYMGGYSKSGNFYFTTTKSNILIKNHGFLTDEN